jgi:hypothetical protein
MTTSNIFRANTVGMAARLFGGPDSAGQVRRVTYGSRRTAVHAGERLLL